MTKNQLPSESNIYTLYSEIRQLIESAKTHVVTQINQALVLTYWQIGKAIKEEVLLGDRVQYGDATIKRLSEKLVEEYGNGFGQRNLFRMVRFFQQFPDSEIVTTVLAQLSGRWSYMVGLL